MSGPTIQAEAPRLVLASASAARAGLLRAAGLRFTTVAAAVDEAALKQSARAEGLDAAAAALLLAEHKALRVSRRNPDALVVGCDQILVCEGAWFDKPADPAAAADHLRRLRGCTHVLHTAVVCARGDTLAWRHVAAPRLHMRAFTDAFLDAYLLHEAAHVTQTVGAYRLEALGAQLFDRIEGEHAAILGLPLLALLAFLRQHRVLLD